MDISRKEKQILMEIFNTPMPVLSADENAELGPRNITPMGADELWRLTEDDSLYGENGIRRLASGGWLVSVRTALPYVRPEMIPWWFWWYPQSSDRFMAWFPEEHIDIAVKEKYLYDGPYMDFLPSTHYSFEVFGGKRLHITKQFVKPTDFGFSRDAYPEKNITRIITARLGIMRGSVQHSGSAHIFRKLSSGMEVISRYWMGEKILPPFQSRYFTAENISEVARHCRREYTRLAQILPGLYNAFR